MGNIFTEEAIYFASHSFSGNQFLMKRGAHLFGGELSTLFFFLSLSCRLFFIFKNIAAIDHLEEKSKKYVKKFRARKIRKKVIFFIFRVLCRFAENEVEQQKNHSSK
jgi:hypothetical protein